MDGPSEHDEPQHAREHEVSQGRENAALEKLPESGDEEAGKGCDNVSG